jgi:hypothetical protein
VAFLCGGGSATPVEGRLNSATGNCVGGDRCSLLRSLPLAELPENTSTPRSRDDCAKPLRVFKQSSFRRLRSRLLRPIVSPPPLLT